MSRHEDPRFRKRDAQLAEDFQWLNNTPQGRRIIAHIMVWGNVYSQIDENDPIALARAVGENNFAKHIAYLLGYRAEHYDYVQRSQDDTNLINSILNSRQQH